MWTDNEIIVLRKKFKNKKMDAKRENTPFTITLAHFKELCAPRKNFYNQNQTLKVEEMSLHKINPHLGYIPGNCVITDVETNRKLGGLTPIEHIELGTLGLKHTTKL